jgi:predicted O-methyltransferase YrrM
MEFTIEHYLPQLAHHWAVSEDRLHGFLRDLHADKSFLPAINDKIRDVPDFTGKQFVSAAEMRVYRCLLYVAARALEPTVFIETGVQNGMSSAFILLALQHNKKGRLYSVDLPPVEQRILDQGTNPLPKNKTPGWIIPDQLRDRHELLLGPAEELLPRLLADLKTVDVFLHDSDHSYSHIMFEIGLAWRYLRAGGDILIDNVEQNAAFADFARGTQASSLLVSTFAGSDRTWQHGLIKKPAE